MNEAAFLRQVLALARLRGWRTAHFRPGRTRKGWRTPVQGQGKGFPDLALVRGATLIVAELKSDRGLLTLDQAEWIKALLTAGVDVRLWRPRDWAEIESVLD